MQNNGLFDFRLEFWIECHSLTRYIWDVFKMYSDKVIEHFMSPQNVGSMPDANGEGTFGDPACGDFLTIYIKVKNNIIEDISF